MANASILAAFERMWLHIKDALSSKSDADHNHDSSYDAKGAADAALLAAKEYAGQQVTQSNANLMSNGQIGYTETDSEGNEIVHTIDPKYLPASSGGGLPVVELKTPGVLGGEGKIDLIAEDVAALNELNGSAVISFSETDSGVTVEVQVLVSMVKMNLSAGAEKTFTGLYGFASGTEYSVMSVAINVSPNGGFAASTVLYGGE